VVVERRASACSISSFRRWKLMRAGLLAWSLGGCRQVRHQRDRRERGCTRRREDFKQGGGLDRTSSVTRKEPLAAGNSPLGSPPGSTLCLPWKVTRRHDLVVIPQMSLHHIPSRTLSMVELAAFRLEAA